MASPIGPTSDPSLPPLPRRDSLSFHLCGGHLLIHPEKLRLRGDIQGVIWLCGAWRGEIDGLNGPGRRGHIHMIILCYCPPGSRGSLSNLRGRPPLLCSVETWPGITLSSPQMTKAMKMMDGFMDDSSMFGSVFTSKLYR